MSGHKPWSEIQLKSDINFEDDLENAFQVFVDQDTAPNQLRRAAGSVKDYFNDIHQADGAVTIKIEAGKIAAIVVVDTQRLETVDAALTQSLSLELTDVVSNILPEVFSGAKIKATAKKATKSVRRAVGLDPAKVKRADQPFPKNNNQ